MDSYELLIFFIEKSDAIVYTNFVDKIFNQIFCNQIFYQLAKFPY